MVPTFARSQHSPLTQDGAFRFFLTTDCLQIITEPSPFGIPGTVRSNCSAVIVPTSFTPPLDCLVLGAKPRRALWAPDAQYY